MKGNTHCYDQFVLDAVLENKFIDVNNVAYNYDVTSEFTWEFRDLVEIKKRKRIVRKYFRPTPKVMMQLQSASKWQRAFALKKTQNNKKVIRDYKLFTFMEDPFVNNDENILPGEFGEVPK